MKNQILLLLAFIVYPLLVSAQTINFDNCTQCYEYFNPKFYESQKDLIVYDFKCKRIYGWNSKKKKFAEITEINDVKINAKSKLRFLVVNINRYIYDVSLSVNDVEYTSEMPILFNEMYLGNSADINSLLSKLKIGSEADASLVSVIDSYIKKVEDYNLLISKIRERQENIYSYCANVNETCCNKTIGININLADSIVEVKRSYIEAYYFLEGEIQKSKLDSTQKHVKLVDCKESTRLRNKIKIEIDSIEFLTKLNSADANRKQRIKFLKKVLDSIPDCSVNEFEIKLMDKSKEIKNYKNKQDIIKGIQDLLNFPSADTVFQTQMFIKNINRDHFMYMSPPIYPLSDRINLLVNILPRDNSGNFVSMPLYSDSFLIDLPVYKKTIFSFSSGPFLGLSKKFKDEIYSWQGQPDSDGIIRDSSNYRITNTGESTHPIGISAFANISRRLSSNNFIGFSTGIGMTIEKDPKISYMFGTNFSFGDMNQLNLIMGAAFMNSYRLSDQYSNDISQVYAPPLPTISYKKIIQAGFFVAVNYTIYTVRSKTSIKSGSKK